MIVGTVFLSILNQMEYHLVQNLQENCHHDHIPFNVKGIGNVVFSVYQMSRTLPPIGIIEFYSTKLGIPLKYLCIILVWCSRGFRGALNWDQMMSSSASPSEACGLIATEFPLHTISNKENRRQNVSIQINWKKQRSEYFAIKIKL